MARLCSETEEEINTEQAEWACRPVHGKPLLKSIAVDTRTSPKFVAASK